MQTATSGRGTQVGVSASEQVGTDTQRGGEVDRVVPAETFLFGKIAGLGRQDLGDLHDRELIPQTCEARSWFVRARAGESRPPRPAATRTARASTCATRTAARTSALSQMTAARSEPGSSISNFSSVEASTYVITAAVRAPDR